MHCHRTGSFPCCSLPSTHLTPPPSSFPMLLLALHPVVALWYQSAATRLAPASSPSQTTPASPLPRRHTQAETDGCHAMWDCRIGARKGQTVRQTDVQPCDFSVILESILSNFAICLGGSAGSAELICRLLALLRLYRTSFWSGMQALFCSPLQLRGVPTQAPGSQHSIICLTERHVQNTCVRKLRSLPACVRNATKKKLKC